MVELSVEALRRVQIHAALADPGRLAIVDRLLLADASPSELQSILAMSSNLIAHHVGVLEGAGIVRRRRSEGDRRRTYLQMIPEALDALVPATARRAERVVFVCTQNSARSQLAVAVWNLRSSLPATSAGTHPATEVNPGAVAAARRHDLPMRPQTPRHVTDIVSPGDFVVAVCDNAHEELSPDLRRLHWSIPDPVQAAAEDAFDRVVDDLTNRIDRLVPILQPS
ncbi:helix-turn-helix domain-containing protein [Mycobacterium intracellulare]|uniref:arsenate reductase/protein-tyrosine-phosphatase family protein n=1 Tax=Mycobacterium intracellulare TaxID=1767 RepID=UPI001CDA1039|nr:helix-turn-helix domain-containing protein [Mycobacterium intracellulare]MCA2306403.1 helix-turn-helix domain-containing protein [Mycobacterium intracellulare]MCA2348751.1 helix-turn-helix domain-containing protein [Mycobacterium intracellulare]